MDICNDLTAFVDTYDVHEEKFDFKQPEDVLIEVICQKPETGPSTWDAHFIEQATVIYGPDKVTGAASYEIAYGGFLDYVIQDLIECPGSGFWVVEGVTGHYLKGDGWSTDDDMDYYYENVRPATQADIDMA